jgi:PAS domain S-box-containing protein
VSISRTAALADHLDDRADSIIAHWRATVERHDDVPDARRLNYREFVDHVPEILDRIADRLRGESGEVVEEAQKHGIVRWRQGYEVAELVAELAHLRSTLLHATFAHAKAHAYDLESIERATQAINHVLDEAAAESVRQYQENSESQSGAMLLEMERRKESVDSERLKLQTVLNSLPVGVWVINADGLVVGTNREAERLQGFSTVETINQISLHDHHRHYALFHLDGTPVSTEELPGIRALRGEQVFQDEMFWRIENVRQMITANASPLLNHDGSIAGAVVVVQDVTEREALKAELATSEARFRSIAEQSPMMVWRTDPAGRCDYFNQTWLDFRGRSQAQETGEGWTSGIHPEDLERVQDAFRVATAAREPFEIVSRLQRRDDVYRWIVHRGAPYFDAHGTFLGYLGSGLDITERIELESALERQSEHKSRLMAALSHDARTPLNAVVLAAQLLQTQITGHEDFEVQESLRVIRNSVRNVLDLLSDLLDLTRIDAGATPADITRFDAESTLRECLSSIEPQARAKCLDVRFEPDGLAGINLATDRNKLKQILSNLLSNALHYTETGHIRLFAERKGDRMRISVEDTGIGIAPDDRHKIFDEFATLGQGRRDFGESSGTGLGLAICRRLASLLQGEILLDSEPGHGSTFTISLPESTIDTGRLDVEEPVVAVSASLGPILIAEDHEPSRRALARVLQRLGYRILQAGTGFEALEQVRIERPFLVLMDVNMPGMDGIEATRALRNDPATRDLPIFALTGDVTIVNRRRIGEAGVDGYLEKPVTWDQIERALARVRDRLPND